MLFVLKFEFLFFGIIFLDKKFSKMEKIIWEKLKTKGEIFSPRTGFIYFNFAFIFL